MTSSTRTRNQKKRRPRQVARPKIALFHMFDVHKQEVCAALPLKGMNGAGHESESESETPIHKSAQGDRKCIIIQHALVQSSLYIYIRVCHYMCLYEYRFAFPFWPFPLSNFWRFVMSICRRHTTAMAQ